MTRKKKRAAISPTNLDLFEQDFLLRTQPEPERSTEGLPSVEVLYQRFHAFNVKYFAGKLPTPKIRYSERLLAAGLFVRNRQEIVISRKYHEIFPDELDDTLKHEMIHIVYFNHDADFKREAKRIGASVRAKSHPKLRLPSRYLYICKSCGTEYPRRKRLISASCGRCSPRQFDPKFKLVLNKKLAK